MRAHGTRLAILCLLFAVTSQLTLPTSCGTHHSTSGTPEIGKRVVFGIPVNTVKYPWSVIMYDVTTGWLACGGAILGENLVLTAAHCFIGRSSNEVYLRAGVVFNYGNNALQSEPMGIAQLIRHPGFNKNTYENDIAIIRINDTFHFNEGVQPVCFPNSNHTLTAGTLCRLGGYGDTLWTGDENRLNEIQVPVVDDSYCSQWLSNFVPDVNICAGFLDGGPDTCSGDSGSALVCPHSDGKEYVYGISSWGNGCGERRKPGVYTNVLRYADWVLSNIQSMQ